MHGINEKRRNWHKWFGAGGGLIATNPARPDHTDTPGFDRSDQKMPYRRAKAVTGYPRTALFVLSICTVTHGSAEVAIVDNASRSPTTVQRNDDGGVTVNRTGELPRNITPRGEGGYSLIQPGRAPATATRDSEGNYSISKPGQLPGSATRSREGGYVINRPGQLPTTVTPTKNGGYSINKVGELPTFITPSK